MHVYENELPNIVDQEKRTARITINNHAREIELLVKVMNVLTSAFNQISSFEYKENNDSEYMWLLLSVRCLHSIRCSTDLLIKGYYSQAMSIIRTIIEDYFICGNAQTNSDISRCLLHNEFPLKKSCVAECN